MARKLKLLTGLSTLAFTGALARYGGTRLIIQLRSGHGNGVPVAAAQFAEPGPQSIGPCSVVERLLEVFRCQLEFSHALQNFRILRLHAHGALNQHSGLTMVTGLFGDFCCG